MPGRMAPDKAGVPARPEEEERDGLAPAAAKAVAAKAVAKRAGGGKK